VESWSRPFVRCRQREGGVGREQCGDGVELASIETAGVGRDQVAQSLRSSVISDCVGTAPGERGVAQADVQHPCPLIHRWRSYSYDSRMRRDTAARSAPRRGRVVGTPWERHVARAVPLAWSERVRGAYTAGRGTRPSTVRCQVCLIAGSCRSHAELLAVFGVVRLPYRSCASRADELRRGASAARSAGEIVSRLDPSAAKEWSTVGRAEHHRSPTTVSTNGPGNAARPVSSNTRTRSRPSTSRSKTPPRRGLPRLVAALSSLHAPGRPPAGTRVRARAHCVA